MEVVVRRPVRFMRWRWFLCYHLIKLAARLYPMRLQFFRESELTDDVQVPRA